MTETTATKTCSCGRVAAASPLPEAMAGVRSADGPDFSDALVACLRDLGVSEAYGVCGGAIARFWQALLDSGIRTLHFRHEAGAAFAATEASIVHGRPVCVFCTTGPGLLNAVTGIAAARAEGATLIVVSPRTSAAQRGSFAAQETSELASPSSDLFHRGWLFDEVFLLESTGQLPQVGNWLSRGVDRPGPFVAHVNVPVSLQNEPCATRWNPGIRRTHPAGPSDAAVDEAVALLAGDPFAIWVGSGARHAAPQVRDLQALTGAPVLATPRGKGIVPEDGDGYLGVTGIGGHDAVVVGLQRYRPTRILVLGTRLSEASSAWDKRLVPPAGFIHVDIDTGVFGTAFPGAPVVGIQGDAAKFLDAVLARGSRFTRRQFRGASPFPADLTGPAPAGLVRQEALMAAIQRMIVERTDAPILVEPGSAMAWAPHYLRFRDPGRLRTVGGIGSMGQMVAGVCGAAHARGGLAVALTGDGSLLMNNEINTAVAYGLPAVWITLNDARYGMVEAGMRLSGRDGAPSHFPACDFAAIAQAMGARAERVDDERHLDDALRRAVESGAPYLVDVIVDPARTAPFGARMRTLRDQANGAS